MATNISVEGYASNGDFTLISAFIPLAVDVYANGNLVAEGLRCKRADPCVIDVSNAPKIEVKICRGVACGGDTITSSQNGARFAYVNTGHDLKVYGPENLEVIDAVAEKE